MANDISSQFIASALAQLVNPELFASLVDTDRKHVWLVAAPKTGSTWLNAILREVLEWPTNQLTLWPTSQTIFSERREQEVDPCTILPFLRGNLYSAHQHCRMSGVTADFVNRFRVKVVLHGRDLLDSLVSFRDYTAQGFFAIPMAYVEDDFTLLSPERQLDFVIDVVTPWYLNFYGSWFDQHGVDYFWSSYESLIEDPPKVVSDILAWAGEERSTEQIQSAIDRAAAMPTRLNVGRVGRGEEMMTPKQRGRVANLVSYYSKVDFSRVFRTAGTGTGSY